MSHHYLAFDYGTKYIGVAVGQDVTLTAQPLTTIKQGVDGVDWLVIKKIVKQWSPQALIVGIPYEMQERNQWMTDAAQKFSEQLAVETQCVVHTIDERLSTAEAKQSLFEQGGHRALVKEAIDAMAAKFILEVWFDANL